MTEHTYIFIIEDNLPMVIRVCIAFYEQVVFNNRSVHSFHFLGGKSGTETQKSFQIY